MSIAIMSMIWKHSAYRGEKLLVLLALADWANDSGYCWPAIPAIAKKARITKRGAIRVLQHFVAAGVIEIVENGGGRGKTTVYRIKGEAHAGFHSLKGERGTPFLRTRKGDPRSGFTGRKGDRGSSKRVTVEARKGDRGTSAIRKNHHEPSEKQPSIYSPRPSNTEFKLETFDNEAFVEIIRKLYVRGCNSPTGWNACCEAIDIEMKENPGWEREQAAAFILERTAIVSDLMRSQPTDQHAFWPTLVHFMTDRQYRDSDSTFERKHGNQQSQQIETRAEIEERRSHEAIQRAARNLVARHRGDRASEADGVDQGDCGPAADH